MDASELTFKRVALLGVGAFTQALMRHLRGDGAEVTAYLTRDYAHYGPLQEGPCTSSVEVSNPCPGFRERRPDFLIPMSLEWALRPWTAELLGLGIPILCPTGEGLRLERERDFARELCRQTGIPFPRSHLIPTRAGGAPIRGQEPPVFPH